MVDYTKSGAQRRASASPDRFWPDSGGRNGAGKMAHRGKFRCIPRDLLWNYSVVAWLNVLLSPLLLAAGATYFFLFFFRNRAQKGPLESNSHPHHDVAVPVIAIRFA